MHVSPLLTVAATLSACAALPKGEFEIYGPSPSFQVDSSSILPPASLIPPPAHTPQALSHVVETSDSAIQHLQITKKQLEELASFALNVKFDLDVVSDASPKGGDASLKALGTIPVHLRIKELRIGGVSLPRIHSESLNQKVDPVNFGNIRT
ncbi:hypothetical protein BGZ58_010450 [Dissophora ornata]|nr:hypothetical protein BGZ58_010450 [Dissophora ornata]